MKNIVIHSGKGGLSNPIFKYGILIDISKDLNSQIRMLIDGLSNYEANNLSKISKILEVHYDDERRKEDFRNIIKI